MTPTGTPMADVAAATTSRSVARSRLTLNWRDNAAAVLLGALVLYGLVFVDNFATTSNLVQIVQSQAFVGIVAIGMTAIVLSGSFVDLSVPASMAVAANAVLLLNSHSIPLAVVSALLLPLLIGFANGLAVGVWSLNPVIATLGTRTLVGGLLFLATTGDTSMGESDAFSDFGRFRVVGVPMATMAFVVLLFAAHTMMTRTRFGAGLRFIGANRRAAKASGLADTTTTVLVFVFASGCSAVAGILLAGFSNTAELVTGRGYEFDALAAVVIGGTSLAGGTGSMLRTLVGVLVIGVTNNVLLLSGLDTSTQLLVKAGVFVLAVAVDAASHRSRR